MKKIFSKKRILIALYAFLISFVMLLLASKNSFLYPFNDWVDANAFFTVGKSMMHGMVPYRDLFEQKGPFLYLIYGIGSLISFKSFLGIFILEVLFWTIALIYLYKILKMFLSTRVSLLILPIFMSIIATTRAFTHGGSAEEFCAPFFFITLYYFIKHFKVKELTKKEMLLNGVIAGFILLTKYTLLGFWFSFTLAIFVDYIMKKDYKKAIIYPLTLLLGMFIPFSICLIYLGINQAINDFFYNYFYINMTAYNENVVNIFTRIYQIFSNFIHSISLDIPSLLLLIITLLFIWKLNLNKRCKILLLITILITILGVYFGLKNYRYYLLFILFFISLGLLSIFNLFDKYLKDLNNKIYIPLIIFVGGLMIFNSCYNANYKEYMKLDKEDFFQFEFASIINEEENPTMVNLGKLDSGVYTLSGLYPSTYFFERQNISYKKFSQMVDSFKEYIKNKETMFIVYYTWLDEDNLKIREEELFINYDLIKVRSQIFEDKVFYGYLFKVRI